MRAEVVCSGYRDIQQLRIQDCQRLPVTDSLGCHVHYVNRLAAGLATWQINNLYECRGRKSGEYRALSTIKVP